ncbi:oligosaccharide flippase family protein [Mangrovibacterium sp.]|uniref:oligosaccharide flippase family protein n=1 Tax=Mangrovibacterium sp. TaxID=1961364 RepID=UPI00356314FE
MKRKFFTNLLLLLALNLLIKPFWIFGIDRTVQNMLGAGDYGLYFSLFNFSLVLNIFLDLGLTNFNNRAIARYRQLLPKYLSYLVSLKFLLALFYGVVCAVVAIVIGYDQRQIHLLLFLAGNQFLLSFTLYLRSNISALHYFRTDSLLSVLDRSLMIILCSTLLFTNWFGGYFSVEWFVYAQTLAYLTTAFVAFMLVLNYSGGFRLKFNYPVDLFFLKKSFPFALLILFMSVYSRIDSVLIERLLPINGKEQAGIYAQAFRLLDAAAIFGLLFAGLLLPIFARMLKQKKDVSQMVRFSFELIMVPSLLIAIAANFYAGEIMNLLYHEHTFESAGLLSILIVCLPGISTTYIIGTLLTANGNLKSLNRMAFFFVLVNVGLNVLFIPRFQAEGAAWIALCTQLGIAGVQLVLAWFYFEFRVNYLLILRLLSFCLFSLVAGKISLYIENWIFGFSFLILCSMIFAASIRLVNLQALIEIINDKNR